MSSLWFIQTRMAVGRESGCSRTKGCVLLSSDEVRGITVLSALRRYCCCVCARSNVFFRRAGADGRTGGVWMPSTLKDWRCHSVATILPYHWIRWLGGIFYSVFDCFRSCFWMSCFRSLSLMGKFHAVGVTGDTVSVKYWLHTVECSLFLDMYYVVWISDVFYFPCASSYR